MLVARLQCNHVATIRRHLTYRLQLSTRTHCHKHDVFNHKVDKEREEAVTKQLHIHGGLNKLLAENGHCPIATCKLAIEKAFSLGLIGLQTYKECIAINNKSNKAKHKW